MSFAYLFAPSIYSPTSLSTPPGSGCTPTFLSALAARRSPLTANRMRVDRPLGRKDINLVAEVAWLLRHLGAETAGSTADCVLSHV
ncbi:hypothetical protein P170DRAFT_434772 [Aspergillus steynii IBT 23096]|uniref:Uncharacterized protein n=1 Tax=Aspergillus steynii IBT 23096 TaxID=1392250 RepID=A0A2I2GJJ5_9EURO|nr:uncharacterized protein P170DRAFT_434772 [Aspergillus steynii IBT 23096]PLB53049.1 hypothetical protein P170DRAFT_434772 [Aspergillus steynii IBT 23096]